MFTVKRIGEIVRQMDVLRYPLSIPLPDWKMQVRSGETRPNCSDLDGTWEAIPADGIWGGHQEYRVFSGKIVIPEAFREGYLLNNPLASLHRQRQSCSPPEVQSVFP